MKRRRVDRQRGFTIIELMIATAVLSVILLLVTFMMIKIGNLYYKGINQARVQRAVRNITDGVTQELQLSHGIVYTGTANQGGFTVNAYCIGNTRYSYVVGVQIGAGKDTDGSNRIAHVLWRDTNVSGGCSPLNLTQADPTATAGAANSVSGSGSELISPNSRLTDFTIAPAGANPVPHLVQVEVAYGDADLLTGTTGFDVVCRGGIGDQFCATARLKTVVVQRL